MLKTTSATTMITCVLTMPVVWWIRQNIDTSQVYIRLPHFLMGTRTSCRSAEVTKLWHYIGCRRNHCCYKTSPRVVSVLELSPIHPGVWPLLTRVRQVPIRSNNFHVEHGHKPGSLLILLYFSIILCRPSSTVAGFGFSGFSKLASFSVTSSFPCCSCNIGAKELETWLQCKSSFNMVCYTANRSKKQTTFGCLLI